METTSPQCWQVGEGARPSLNEPAITIKRSTFMTKEIRFCLKADEAPSLPGAYAMVIELGAAACG
jgi:hypothetical protein